MYNEIITAGEVAFTGNNSIWVDQGIIPQLDLKIIYLKILLHLPGVNVLIQ